METELARCPACTAVVTLTRPDGRFVICTTCDQAWNADTFNTLARRAEVGRLVEMLLVPNEANSAMLDLIDVLAALDDPVEPEVGGGG